MCFHWYIYGINQNKQSGALHKWLKKIENTQKTSPKLVFGILFLHIPILYIVKAFYLF